MYNVREFREKRIESRVAAKMLYENVHALRKHGYSTEEALDMLDSSAEERTLYYLVSGDQAPRE